MVVFVLLVPSGGNDSDPPECFSWFGYVVPCGFGPDQQPSGSGFAAAGAVVGALLVVGGSAVGRRDTWSD